jgi:hypothetical protein
MKKLFLIYIPSNSWNIFNKESEDCLDLSGFFDYFYREYNVSEERLEVA